MSIVVYDVETTGLKRSQSNGASPIGEGDEVIQIGGVVLNKDFKPIRLFCYYCDAIHAEVSASALSAHGISLESIRQYIPDVYLEDVMRAHLPEFYEEDFLGIGYNVDFDSDLINYTMRGDSSFKKLPKKTPRIGVTRGRNCIDVMDFFKERWTLSSRLQTAKEEFSAFFEEYCSKLTVDTNIPELFNASQLSAHNALYDTIATYVLFCKYVLPKFPRRR